MTVQDVQQFIEYTGNGAQTDFAFVFRADDTAWIAINFTDDFDSITLNADQDIAPGGTLSYFVAPPSGQLVRIERQTPKNQNLDYTRYDAFDSESHEDTLDKLTMLIQDLCETASNLQAQIDLLLNNVFFNFCIQNQVLTSVAGAVEFDYQLGMGITLNLTENITAVTFDNIPVGGNVCQFELDIRQDSTPRVITWPPEIIWPAATIPDITVADSITQVHLRTTDDGVTWLGSYVENLG